MNENMCLNFEFVWKDFPDTLDGAGNYQFKNDQICDAYCDGNCDKNCKTDLDKINVACFALFEMFFKNSDSLMENAKNNINIAGYILVWLSYILSLKGNEGIKNINDFYEQYIKDKDKYTAKISGVTGYTSYQNLIDKYKELMTADNNYMSKLYPPLKSLCELYNGCIICESDCTNCLEKANDFAQKYNELENSNNNESDSYKNILYSLSTDYNHLKRYLSEVCHSCHDTSFPNIEAPRGSFQIFEATSSSSSIASKLIPTLLVFAISVFLGIAYKYSLFGFDKRLHKQYLREKVKKIKKKMNHYI
ncbi:Plasmodium variant antigen protein Cir/Yir/Bir, putative [Plasmodium chabaudi adami]|uniref:Plasmodium variant antigen protein Cir/Yir/Bir, putative n=1 Tax=Plasmodium chabaudi adami TaxID=5826 RepID=A0A1C6WD85_PLACE|nr:Plasmodium variant antigen protein Cir/Yir/Bir, putative [Plasmodium chabaudi adami]